MSNTAPVRSDGLEIVIVGYGPPELLERCLRALNGKYEIVVVDNSSSPRVRAVVEQAGGAYLDPGCNLGFAAAVNIALRQRRDGNDVLLLNPDAVIMPAAVEKLRELLASQPRMACVAPSQRAPGSDQPDRVEWPFPSPTDACLGALGLSRLLPTKGFLIGSVLLLRGEALRDVGLFDERFFLYAEEADWQRRATQRGWSVQLATTVQAEHVGAGTGGDQALRELRFHAGQERYIRKWYGSSGWQLYRAAAIFGAAVRWLAPRRVAREKDRQRALIYLRGPERDLRRHLGASSSSQSVLDGGATPSLKIVHVVCTDAFAGVERYVTTVAAAVAALGCEVTVLGGDKAQMRRSLDPAGIRWFPASTIASAVWRLWRVGRVDIVHVHMFDAELAAGLAVMRNRAPVVASRHFAARRGSSAPARLVGRLISKLPAAQLAISEFVANAIEGDCIVVEPGVQDVAETSLTSERRKKVLMLQRLEPEKRSEVGLDAFARSGLAARGWELVIAGGGIESARLQTLARSLGIASSCRFLGPQSDVDQLYRQVSIFLATRPEEPFGISVVEAMAHRLPVVAAAGGGHNETVGRCEDARLFSPGDSEQAAGLLQELALDAVARKEYGARLRQIQRERFTVDRQARGTFSVYQSVVNARRARD